MARKIKRLLYQWKPIDVEEAIQTGDFKTWRDEFAWWRRAGVAPKTLIGILESAYVERRKYEEELQERRTRARNIRKARKALKEAAPLIQFLKTQRALDDDGSPELVFGGLGGQVEHAVQRYIDDLQRIVPRGRPGDSWLRKFVILLAIELMSGPLSKPHARPRRWVRQSEKGTISAIERVLKLAGHGEVVTKEKIRHVVRTIRPAIHKRREMMKGESKT